MLMSFALGAAAQLSLVLSGLTVSIVKVPRPVIGAFASFGAGALVAAVARDLLPTTAPMTMFQVSAWTLGGALTFVLADHWVEKKFSSSATGGALGIVVGSIVDGVPESIIFGIQLATGARLSLAFLAAVFVSNIPQALAPSAGLAEAGWSPRRVAGLWLCVVLACGAAAAFGEVLATPMSGANGARAGAFAAGGILAMLSDSLIPFAHERCGEAGLWSVVGFCSALAMS